MSASGSNPRAGQAAGIVGAKDVSSGVVKTQQQVAATQCVAMKTIPLRRIQGCANRGMMGLTRRIADRMLQPLAAGACLLSEELSR